ncbi:MAG: rhodanese-like domain-containing protein [Cyclonatronaceae bacterium]
MNTLSTIIIAAAAALLFFYAFQKFSSPNMDINENIKKKIEEQPGTVIDVRTKAEHDEGHLAITDAQYDVMNGDFQAQIPKMDKNKTYYLYCRSGNRSGQAARMMKQEGFENVYNIGGFDDLVHREGFEPND